MEINGLFLILGVVAIVNTATPKCKNWGESFLECKHLINSDYPLELSQFNGTFNLTLTNTVNLPANAISGIKIEKLVIRDSTITNIAKNAFTGHERTLKILHISTLEKQVPAPTQSLENLFNLEELKISSFVLNQTFNHINFVKLSRLQSLYLEDNQLSYFGKPVFKGLSALTKLTIRNNKFTSIPLPSVFEDLLNLTSLDMSDNNIQKITEQNLVKSKNLKQLILKENAIVEVEKDAFKGLEKSLEVLDLRLNSLNDAQLLNMAEMTSLRELNLQYNRIQVLPNGVFQNFSLLQVLSLNSNKLSNITKGSFRGLVSLKTLQLNFNSLTVETGTLLDTPQLQEIYFKKQNKKLLQMEWLQDAATSLLKLYLDENTFNKTSLWQAIRTLENLEYLSLSKCNLGYIPDFAFEQNRQLKTLNLDRNSLQVLRQETFQGLQENLKSINLELNDLQTVDECVFQHFKWSLQQEIFPINLFENKLICNCSLLWLKKWIQIYLAIPFPITSVRLWQCAPSMEYIYLANLTCDSNSTNRTCQDFSDKYTTLMAPTTITIFSTVFAETTSVSSTFSTTARETTFMSTKETTIPPTSTQTPTIPTLFLLLEKLSSSSISISWNISNWKHVQELSLVINKVVENVDTTKTVIDISKMDSNSKILTNLITGTILTVCIQLRLDFSLELYDRCDIIRLLKTQKAKSDNVGIYIGIGVGSAVLITLILSLLGLMCHNRMSKNSSDKHKSKANLNQPKTTLKTKRYQKRKNPNNEPQVSVISAEPFQPIPHLSAGSYQYLADPNLTNNSTQNPQNGYDNEAFTESIDSANMPQKMEKNNNERKSMHKRPLPNLPGSQSFMQYFQPEAPIYVNVQPHYAEISHTETTI